MSETTTVILAPLSWGEWTETMNAKLDAAIMRERIDMIDRDLTILFERS